VHGRDDEPCNHAVSAGPTLASPSIALEEQGLTQNRGYGRRLERLGDQERWFWTLACQESFRVRSDENDRDLERPQHFVHRVEAGAAVCELDVGKNDPGPFAFRQRNRLGMRARNTEHAMAKAFNQSFQIKRYECFVFNDENVGRNLGCEFSAGFLYKLTQGRRVDIKNLRGIVLGQSFQSNEKECLAGFRRNLGEMALNRLSWAGATRCLPVNGNGIPDLREKPIEGDPGRKSGLEDLRILN
jgi:hypothetical protein